MTDTHIQQLQQLVAEWERTGLPALQAEMAEWERTDLAVLRALLDESTHTGEEEYEK
jgi:hypothetical protein